MSNIQIKCTFRISDTSRMTEKALTQVKGKNTIQDLAKGINLLALRYENMCMQKFRATPSNSSDYLKYIKKAISELELIDTEKTEHQLSVLEYNPFVLDEIQFIYANVLEENQYVKDKIHILAEYMDPNGVLRKGIFVAKKDWYEKINPEPIFNCNKVICGFCKRKTVKVAGKVNYDKYSHSSFKTSKDTTKNVTTLSVFTMFHISDHGIISTNENEFLLYNKLFQEKIIFEVPQRINIYGFVPDATIILDGKKTFVEIIDEEECLTKISSRISNVDKSQFGYLVAKRTGNEIELEKVL